MRLLIADREAPRLDASLRGCVYVASDLISFSAPIGHGLAPDMGQADSDTFRVYRRLDLRWLGWLAYKMTKLRDQAEDNIIDAATYALMCRRWSIVTAAAVARYGVDAVNAASEAPPDARYQPPKVRKGTELLSIGRPRVLPSPDPSCAPARKGERVLPGPAERAA